MNGRIGKAALHVLMSTKVEETTILWTPGHESLAGNQAAHAAARDHARRAISDTQRTRTDGCHNEDERIPKKYADILAHYRKQRKRYPPAHKRLSREQAVTWRRLQAGTYPHGTLMHAMYPGTYRRDCKFCPPDTRNTLRHMVLECTNNPDVPPSSPPSGNEEDGANAQKELEDQWEALLVTQDPDNQLRLVNRARAAAASHGYLD